MRDGGIETDVVTRLRGIQTVDTWAVVQSEEELHDVKPDWVSCGSVWLHLFAAVGLKSESRDGFLQTR